MTDHSLRLFDRLTDVDKNALAAKFSTKHSDVVQTGAIMRQSIIGLRGKGFITHEQIWSPCLFLNTICYDLSILIEALAYERDEWKRRFVGRQLALLLFEICEDLPTVFGKKFRQSCFALSITSEPLDELSAALKPISAFFHQNHDALKEIRIICSAHRDHDPILLHDTIYGMDLFVLLGLGLTLGRYLNDLGSKSQKIMKISATTPPPELKPQGPTKC